MREGQAPKKYFIFLTWECVPESGGFGSELPPARSTCSIPLALPHDKTSDETGTKCQNRWLALPGPFSSLKNSKWPPFGSPFRPEWVLLGGPGARNFDAGARFRAPFLV